MLWNHLMVDILLTIAPFALTAATGLLAKAAQYALHAVQGIKNHELRAMLDWAINEAQSLADTIVVYLNQVTVNALKAEGKWDATVAARVKQQAMDLWTQTLPAAAYAALKAAIPDLTQWLSALIEESVATAPNHRSPASP